MKQKRVWLILLAAAAALAVGLHVWGAPQYPSPQLPRQDGGTPAYSLDPGFAVPEEGLGTLYTFQAAEVKEIEAKAAKLIGVESLAPYSSGSGLYYVEGTGDTVTIDPSGFWSITNEGKPIGDPQLPPPGAPAASLPDDKEAAETAKAYIKENGLYEGECGEPAITHTTGWDSRPMTVDVTFSPLIGGKDVYGLYRLRVSIGEGGRVQQVFVQAPALGVAADVPLKTQGQVEEEARSHPENIRFLGESPGTAVLADCRLAYYVDGTGGSGRVYAYPVYIMSVEGGGTAIMDAVRHK